MRLPGAARRHRQIGMVRMQARERIRLEETRRTGGIAANIDTARVATLQCAVGGEGDRRRCLRDFVVRREIAYP